MEYNRPHMVLSVKIDTRETALINHLDTSFDYKIEPLDIGDVHIADTEHNINLIFERKTIADLAASIKDGRYKEQKHRLLSNFGANKITYIIEEGHIIPKDAHGLRKSVFAGVYMNSMYRDGVHLVFTKNLAETSLFIHNVATKCKEKPESFKEVEGDYLQSRKAKCRKIDNIDPTSCYKLQLCQIPGVSYKVAEGIIERYPTMFALMAHLGSFTDKATAVKAIAGIPLIGSKKATTFIEYLRPELDAMICKD